MQSKDWVLTIFLALFLVLPDISAASTVTGAFWIPQEEGESETPETPQQEGEQAPDQENEADQDDQEKKPVDDGPDGPTLLDQAFDLKLEAQTPKDLDRIADLCQKALKKGLDEDDQKQAKTLASASLLEFANQLGNRIFQSAGRDRRWQFYRNQAVPRLKRALEFNESLIEAHLLLAKLEALPGGDRDAAQSAIEKAIELAVDDRRQLSEALFVRASLAKDDSARLADLNQAIKIDPENGQARQVRANLFIQQGNPQQALDDYKAWLAGQPSNFQARLLVANNLMAAGEKFDAPLQQAALKLVDEAIEIKPDFTVAYTVKAQIHVIAEEPNSQLRRPAKPLSWNQKTSEHYVSAVQPMLTSQNMTKRWKTPKRCSNCRFFRPKDCSSGESSTFARVTLAKPSMTSRFSPTAIHVTARCNDRWQRCTKPTMNRKSPSKSTTNCWVSCARMSWQANLQKSRQSCSKTVASYSAVGEMPTCPMAIIQPRSRITKPHWNWGNEFANWNRNWAKIYPNPTMAC